MVTLNNLHMEIEWIILQFLLCIFVSSAVLLTDTQAAESGHSSYVQM